MARWHQASEILKAAEEWKKRCLIDGRSMGAPLWAEAKVNDVATQQRLEEARRLLDRLKNKGQG